MTTDKQIEQAMASKAKASPLEHIKAGLAPLRAEAAQYRQDHAVAAGKLQPVVSKAEQRAQQYATHTGSAPLTLKLSLTAAASLMSTGNWDEIDMRLNNLDRAPNLEDEPRRITSLVASAREGVGAMARLALELKVHIAAVEQAIISSSNSEATNVPLSDAGTVLEGDSNI